MPKTWRFRPLLRRGDATLSPVALLCYDVINRKGTEHEGGGEARESESRTSRPRLRHRNADRAAAVRSGSGAASDEAQAVVEGRHLEARGRPATRNRKSAVSGKRVSGSVAQGGRR